MTEVAGRWFGDFDIPAGQRGRWEVGPLSLAVEHAPGEWRVGYARGDDIWSRRAAVRLEPAVGDESAGADRYIVAGNDAVCSVLPLLPDRSVVTRPISPVFVPAGETVRLYVGMPVWLQLAVGAERKALTEIPAQRLSDTWFGPNTREGELCYALRSRCRLALDEEGFYPHRAVTPLRIRNGSGKALLLERVNVPVRQLSLYAEPNGRLWTGEVGLERSEEGHYAALHLESGPPPEARSATPLAGPREPAPKKTVIRAFSALFQ